MSTFDNSPNIGFMFKWYNGVLKLISKAQSYIASQPLRKFKAISGFYPQIHTETSLVNRFRAKGFKQYVKEQKRIDVQEFVDMSEKAHRLYSTEPKIKFNFKKLLNAVNLVYNKCKFDKKFQPLSLSEALNHINTSSGSGYGYHGKKGSNLVNMSNDLLNYITGKDYMSIFDAPLTSSYRLQFRKETSGVVCKTRLIYPLPSWIILAELMFAVPFVEHFKRADTFYTMGISGKDIGRRLKRKMSKRVKHIVGLDVSSFDQNSPNELIVAGFLLLRLNLKLTKIQAILFEYIIAYFCTSLLVTKIGKNLFQTHKTHGVPSGSVFTNLVESMYHAVLMAYLCPEEFENDQVMICGDDNLIATNKDLSFFEKGYSQFNFSLSIEKCDIFKNSKDLYFLGFRWINYIRYIDIELAVHQCIHHSEFMVELDVFEREISRCSSILLNGINGASVFRQLFPEVMKMIKRGEDVRYYYLQKYSPTVLAQSPGKIKTLKNNKILINDSLNEALQCGYLNR